MTVYREYLLSNEWKERRRGALERSKRKIGGLSQPQCEVCGCPGTSYKNSRSSLNSKDRRYRVEYANCLQVHHVHYNTLGNEEPNDLIVLCTKSARWARSGYSWEHLNDEGCHERVHRDPAFRDAVKRIAGER